MSPHLPYTVEDVVEQAVAAAQPLTGLALRWPSRRPIGQDIGP
jgi:hypothetical protein